MSTRRQGAFGLIAALLVATCGAPPASTAPSGLASTSPSPSLAPAGLVTGIDGLETAVFQIEVTGTFRDMEAGEQTAGGAGSGFFISPDGTAITNNHVVTGASIVKALVGGTEYPARVVAASECADIAVIKVGSGTDTFGFLDWYAGDIEPGLEIYVAGFPLGDAPFTLTDGIVSRATGVIDEDWAWVSNSFEHTANTNPGNSGGPVVTKDAQVVGIHYAGSSETQQHFGISRDDAQQLLPDLMGGTDVASIGVNGTAINDGDLVGIWVSSVKPGSPADGAGVKPGDIITSLADIPLAVSGTMKEYCEVLRSNTTDSVIPIEIVRFDTSEVLAGQLNGTALAVVTSFANELGEEVDPGSSSAPDVTYEVVTDDTGALSVEVPDTWTDHSTGEWDLEEEAPGATGTTILAAPDVTKFLDTWGTPGMFFGASASLPGQLSYDGMLDLNTFANSCTYDARYDYDDGLYTGRYDVWKDCGDEDALFVVVAAGPEDQSYMILVQVQAIGDADLEALDHIIDTFKVTGALP